MLLVLLLVLLFCAVIGYVLYTQVFARPCGNPRCDKPRCGGECRKPHVCGKCGRMREQCHCPKSDCPFC